MRAASLAVLAALAAAPASAAPFRVYQFALRGIDQQVRRCEGCGGVPGQPFCNAPDVAIETFGAFASDRWVPPRGIKLLGSDCVADAGDLLLGKPGLALAAIRVADDPPRQALLDLMPKAPPAISGWPTPPTRRPNGVDSLRPAPRGDASTLRLAVVCWASAEGWPLPVDRQGQNLLTILQQRNACEWWLLPFRRDSGKLEPDLDAASFLVVPNSRDATAGRFRARRDWPEVFTSAATSLEDALEKGWDTVPVASEEALAASERAMAAAAGTPDAPAPRTIYTSPGAKAGPLPPCGPDVTRDHEAVFARFTAWADKFGISGGDAPAWQAARWQGRCATYEVLRSALEERLGCKLDAEVCAAGGAK